MRGNRLINLFLFLTIFLFMSVPSAKVSAEEEEKVKINAAVGFESVFKLNTTTPVTIDIENNLKDINGECQIEIPKGNYNGSETVSLYVQSVNIAKGSKKRIVMNVPISRMMTSLKINIAEGKKSLITKEVTLPSGLNPNNILIGVMSDDFNSVSYLNRVSINSKQNYATKVVKLDESILPEDGSVLSAFNIIVINNFDTSKISDSKYKALKKWVNDGGLLLIGTGPSNNKTLSVFKDNFISADIRNLSSINTKAIHSLTEGGSSANSFKLEVLNMENVKDSQPVLKEGNLTLLHKIEKGKGVLAVAAFDFGLNPLAGWNQNSNFGEKLFASILPSYYGDGTFDRMSNGMNYANMFMDVLQNIPELPMPKSSRLILLFFIYILIVGPVNYIILKKKDKRELMWITVPVISICFSAAVYISGGSTRVSKPVTNVISVINIDSKGNMNTETYAAILTPSKSEIKVEAPDGMTIKPLAMNVDYVKGPGTSQDSSRNVDSKIYLSPKTAIEYYDTGVFGQQTVTLQNDDIKKGSLASELSIEDGKFTGTIKNNTGMDLSECYLITSASYIELGEIKNGQSKNINDAGTSFSGQIYDLTNILYKDAYNYSTTMSTEELKRRKLAQQKRRLMESYFQMMNMRVSDNTIIAFSSSPISKNLLINSDTADKYEKSMLVSSVKLSFKKGSTAEYPLGYIRPAVTTSSSNIHYDEMNSYVFGDGSGSIELKYTFDSDVKPEKIEMKSQSSGSAFKGMPVVQGKGYIWNLNKKDWDEWDFNNASAEGDKLASYIDSANSLKVKIELASKNAGSIPQIYMKGSVK